MSEGTSWSSEVSPFLLPESVKQLSLSSMHESSSKFTLSFYQLNTLLTFTPLSCRPCAVGQKLSYDMDTHSVVSREDDPFCVHQRVTGRLFWRQGAFLILE